MVFLLMVLIYSSWEPAKKQPWEKKPTVSGYKFWFYFEPCSVHSPLPPPPDILTHIQINFGKSGLMDPGSKSIITYSGWIVQLIKSRNWWWPSQLKIFAQAVEKENFWKNSEFFHVVLFQPLNKLMYVTVMDWSLFLNSSAVHAYDYFVYPLSLINSGDIFVICSVNCPIWKFLDFLSFRFCCAAAVDNRTRLDFHGERRIWDGQFIKRKIKGNSALYIFTNEVYV